MADPLSIASGVAGLISLGLTLCNGLQTYFSAIKDRDKDIEIATRDLNLLRFNIKIIESSASKVGNYYGLAGGGVNMGVKNCESQLKTLEILIRELTSDEGVLGAQQKWRKQKMLIRYPFDQKKLAQLQDQLSKANHTLNTFIQTFNLEVNIGMHNSLQIMDKDMRTNDTAMIDLLSSISTQLNVIGPTVQRTEMAIATLPIQVRDQTMATNNSRPLLNETILNDPKTQPVFISDQHQYLKIIYSSGNASPFDVDQDGNSIAHMCLERYIARLTDAKDLQSSGKAIEAMSRLLSYMFDIGVPVTRSNFYGSTVLNNAAQQYPNLWMLPKLYELATARDPTFCCSEFAHRRTDFRIWPFFKEGEYHRFNVWCEYPEISEAVGFQPIFLAVMQKDLLKLEHLLKDSNSVEAILQKDLYERNILHVSSDWAAGLRLLLEYEAVHPLLNAISALILSPLDHALLYSKMYCNASDQWTLCHNCSCFAAVKLLLEADCSVTVGLWRPQTLKACSLKARMLFLEHLKNRRERLRRISLAHLPAAVLTKYEITTKSLPDATAILLWGELQKQANGRGEREVGLTDSLRPHSILSSSSPESFFSQPHRIEVVELALSYGFQPEDECGVQPFMSRMMLFGNGTFEDVSYAAWLLRRDLEINLTIGPFQLSAVHSYGTFLGFWIKNFYSRSGVLPATSLREFNSLLSMICHSIRHLPSCVSPTGNVMDMAVGPEWQEECAEILDEDQLLLNQLHDLEEEFWKEFEQQNISIANFLQGYWLRRMEEVRGELDGAVSDDYKSDLREIGVVLGESEDGGFNIDSDKLK
ncbi:hypothetical protein HG530_011819 [Fusarium avenaceum]|nr:hypothetical protein HG530_011819 [Fusarium avenaceum]